MTFTAKSLEAYSDLVVRVGLNLRAGQRLIIIGPLANGGASLEAAPLVRRIAVSAYRAGAPLVEVLWGDEELLLLRVPARAARSFGQFSEWLPAHASRTCPARPRRALRLRKRSRPLEGSEPGSDYRGPAGDVARGAGVPGTDFAEPDQLDGRRRRGRALGGEGVRRAPPGQQVPLLWDAIGTPLPPRPRRSDRRLGRAPGRARGAERLPEREALHRAEIHRPRNRPDDRAAARATPGSPGVRSASPGSSSRPTFRPKKCSRSRIAITSRGRFGRPSRSATAARSSRASRCGSKRGASSTRRPSAAPTVLRKLIETDDGAGRLGEVALVPHSSPISQSGRLFYNTLFDENAASHVALGSAYKFTLDGGEAMDDDSSRRGRQQQRHPRRFHDWLGRARRRRRAAHGNPGTADAPRRVDR